MFRDNDLFAGVRVEGVQKHHGGPRKGEGLAGLRFIQADTYIEVECAFRVYQGHCYRAVRGDMQHVAFLVHLAATFPICSEMNLRAHSRPQKSKTVYSSPNGRITSPVISMVPGEIAAIVHQWFASCFWLRHPGASQVIWSRRLMRPSLVPAGESQQACTMDMWPGAPG